MAHPLTAEQKAIVAAVGTRPAPGMLPENLVLEAGAGAGKTSTLEAIARQYPNAKILYIAFGKPQQIEAEQRMPANVTSRTTHALARRVVGAPYRQRIDNGYKERRSSRKDARVLGLNGMQPLRLTTDPTVAPLAPFQVARIAVDTVDRFAHSADREIAAKHVPPVNGVTDEMRPTMIRAILPIAQRAWADILLTDRQLTESGREGLRFSPDYYLKMYSLTDPDLGPDRQRRGWHIILLDESQDTNPCVMRIIEQQTRCQVIRVGDACQAIYGWRGAINAMAEATGRRLYLSQSFRFGPAVAREANKWLGLLGSPLRLRGFDKLDTIVAPTLTNPDAILCRTHVGAMDQVIAAIGAGRKVALVGGGDGLKRLAEAALDLKEGRPTFHPDLCLFTSWGAVQDFVEEDPAAAELKILVTLIDRHGPDRLIGYLDQLVDESAADVTVSTAHKAKGREWDRVQVGDDFPEPQPGKDGSKPVLTREAAMLNYVTVTRAKKMLGLGGLAWVDSWIAAHAPHLAQTASAPDAVVQQPDPWQVLAPGRKAKAAMLAAEVAP